MHRQAARARQGGGAWKVVAAAFLAAACGGSATCPGVEVEGACFVGEEGINVSAERATAVLEQARAFWGVPGDVSGWTIAFRRAPIEIGGQRFDGYCWPGRREILVNPLDGRDCIESSFVWHELGHAWGFGHEDVRMVQEWGLMADAATRSGWPGCAAR